MNCKHIDCSDDAVVFVIDVHSDDKSQQQSYCRQHAMERPPFADAASGRISTGAGLTGVPAHIGLSHIVYFDTKVFSNSTGAGAYFREVAGPKRFCVALSHDEARGIWQAIQKSPKNELSTFQVFASIFKQLDILLEKVHIYDLDPVSIRYMTRLILHHNSTRIEIDVELSDAVAIATALDAPILLDDRVYLRMRELGWNNTAM